MKFTKEKYTNYFSSTDSRAIIYVHPEHNSDDFDLTKCYTKGFKSRFIVFFAYKRIDTHDPNLNNKFLNSVKQLPKDKGDSIIIWIDEPDFFSDPKIIANFPNIFIFKNNSVIDFDLKKGKGNNSILINGETSVRFDESTSRLIFKPEKELVFSANGGSVSYSGAYIDFKIQSGKKAGAIVFENGTFGTNNNPIQIISPYIVYNGVNNPTIHFIKYFADDVIANSFIFSGSFYPYINEQDNLMNVSEFKLIPKDPNNNKINSYFIDDKGNQLYTSDLDKITLVPARVVDGIKGISSFFLTVKNKTEVNFNVVNKNKSAKQYVLLGYSGTEYVEVNEKLKLSFEESGAIIIDNNEIKNVSESSRLTLPFLSSDSLHFTDAEKAPLFNNSEQNYTKDSVRNVPYKHQETPPFSPHKIEKVKPLRIIPTLNFDKQRNDLFKIEKVFSAERLLPPVDQAQQPNPTNPIIQVNPTDHITPQGFKKVGDQFHFIRDEKVVVNITTNQTKDYRFRIGKIDLDLQISLLKDDVFFVTTPELFKKSSTNIPDILFDIGGFEIDWESQTNTGNGIEKIIIFKYSKKSFDTLLGKDGDTSAWSNSGKFSNANLKAIQDNINQHIGSFPDDSDYDYFKRIRTDSNWNGIIILNFPLPQNGLPEVFKGITAFQKTNSNDSNDKLELKTKLKFQFVAFPINKTFINGQGNVDIKSTSFNGLIDYDLVKTNKKGVDYEAVKRFFEPINKDDKNKDVKFILSKLLVKFENSEITNFKSFVFIKIPELFDDLIEKFTSKLTNKDLNPEKDDADEVEHLIRLKGSYLKNRTGNPEFHFEIESDINLQFNNSIIKQIKLTKAAFNYVEGGTKDYRFDFDGSVTLDIGFLGDIWKNFLNFKNLIFQNIGIKFSDPSKRPTLSFDPSQLIVLPEINFNTKDGFLSSFPFKFNHFQVFKIGSDGSIPNLEFLLFSDFKGLNLPPGERFYSLIFDFDLGTLGNLGGLKSLKGELLIGWSKGRGFKLGIRLNSASAQGLHVNLFGALKLDIQEVALGRFMPKGPKACTAYFIKLNNVRLTVLGLELPSECYLFNGIIVFDPNNSGAKIAWLIEAETKSDKELDDEEIDNPGIKDRCRQNNNDDKPTSPDDDKKKELILAVGQRMGPAPKNTRLVKELIGEIKKEFEKHPSKIEDCKSLQLPYKPERDWLIASERILPSDWAKILDFSFIFNDPTLYGVHLALREEPDSNDADDSDSEKSIFSIDIIYKKLSENLGVWSLELELPIDLRNVDCGSFALTIGAIGIEIYTDGSWKLDIGFPRTTDDWSRAFMVQFRTPIPIVGWGGFYFMKANSDKITLFASKEKGKEILENPQKYLILQAGFALRAGVGVYIQKSVFSAGASISYYGIFEGAVAFEKGKPLGFPRNFALQGRVGSIAEIVGYVDFKIIKASVHIILRQEIGLTLIMIDRELQPVTLYIEGEVSVDVDVTIRCFKVFGHRICISFHFSFKMTVRFSYTLGEGGSTSNQQSNEVSIFQPISFKLLPDINWDNPIIIKSISEIPVIYIPGFTKDKDGLHFTSNFAIPFFGKSVTPIKNDEKPPKVTDYKLEFSKDNLLKQIVKGLLGDLIKQLPNYGVEPRYENIRAILLDQEISVPGETESHRIKIKFDNYKSWFITDFQLTTDNKYDLVLRDIFKFEVNDKDDEIAELKKNLDICPKEYSSGVDRKNCLFRLLQIPVSLNILYGLNKDSINGGFEISVENLVKTNGVEYCTTTIEPINCSETYIEKVNTFFDNYRTQFPVHRENDVSAVSNTNDKELRTDSIIPEYFKLIGLLALEAYYNHITDNFKKIENKTTSQDREKCLNPIIDEKRVCNEVEIGISEPDANWNFNDQLEYIIGQVNYFYNNGLRLPDIPSGTSSNSTKSYFEILKQSVDITGVGSGKNVAIKLKKHLLAKDDKDNVEISLTNEVFPSQDDINSFLCDLTKQSKLDLDRLKTSFASALGSPYELIPVTLSIQNNDGGVNDRNDVIADRFFKMPEKILISGGTYRFKLNCGVNSSENIHGKDITEKTSVCANVMMKVKGSDFQTNTDGKTLTKILEIMNVGIDDLNLMREIRTDKDFIGKIASINFYTRNKNTLTKITSKPVTIIKTNLSNKTHPPVFSLLIASTNPQTAIQDPKYIATNKEMQEFAELLWDGLAVNDGGYYLLFEDDLDGFYDKTNPAKQFDLVVSFELSVAKPDINYLPSFCNYFKIPDFILDKPDQQTDLKLYSQLDDNERYLYLELFSQSGEFIPVEEYHSIIPAHCMSFEAYRSRKIDMKNMPEIKLKNCTWNGEAEYSHYLPVEFELSDNNGKTIISKDQVLPLMPVELPVTKSNADKICYKHVSPLINYDDNKDGEIDSSFGIYKNSHRYNPVGEEFKLAFGIRDIYGFRVIENVGELKCEQLYFDKLIPVEAWAPLKFSYWFNSFDEDNKSFTWDLTASIEVEKLPALFNLIPKGKKKDDDQWDVDDNLAIKPESLKKENVIRSFRNVLENLYTIQAQLLGKGVSVKIDGINDSNEAQAFLQKCVTEAINVIHQIYSNQTFNITPALPSLSLLMTKVEGLKTKLSINIKISRDEALCINLDKSLCTNVKEDKGKNLKNESDKKAGINVWEAGLVRSTTSKVQLQNPKPMESQNQGEDPKAQNDIKDLHDAIGTGSKNSFGLGISSNDKREKLIYIINQDLIKNIRVKQIDSADNPLKRSESYYGVKPYSNKLWSGSYKSEKDQSPSNFTNLDLDSGLQIILAKIDQLLNPASLNKNSADTANLNSLIQCKRDLIDKVLSSEIANVDDWMLQIPPPMTEEFKNLLATRLNNFYSYDGLIKLEMTDESLEAINPMQPGKVEDARNLHRLSITINNISGYNLISSKTGYFESKSAVEKRSNNWTILFDKIGTDKDIEFELSPEITHIEYDIGKIEGSDVESSRWIQLLTPVAIAQKIKVDNQPCDPSDAQNSCCDNWERIERSFPPKPIIQNSQAKSLQPHQPVSQWGDEIGKWNYELKVSDRNNEIQTKDQLVVVLKFKSSDNKSENNSLIVSSLLSFQGFISYWSSKIIEADQKSLEFDWKQFVKELSNYKSAENMPSENLFCPYLPNVEGEDKFIFSYIKQNESMWKLLPHGSKVYTLPDQIPVSNGSVLINVSGFDVLKKDSSLTVGAETFLIRNSEAARNSAFIYQTEHVKSATWATPHLHYSDIQSTKTLNEIVKQIMELNRDFKLTAKYILNVSNPDNRTQPFIPVRQLEVKKEAKNPVDVQGYFNGFQNGDPAISLSFYSDSGGSDGDLPVFTADTIVKK